MSLRAKAVVSTESEWFRMHDSAYRNCQKFVEKHLNKSQNLIILDIGSYDVNGSMRPLFTHPSWRYLGADVQAGPNVDVVITDIHQFPFDKNQFDVIVSSSAFEHDEAFWITFNEMVRVSKDGGLIYVCTPTIGCYHPFPVDCWRFMKDSYRALSKWCGETELLEQYIDESAAEWQDNIGIFKVKKCKRFTFPLSFSSKRKCT